MTNLNIGQEILCTHAFNLFMAAIALKRLRHPTNEKLPFGRKYAITDHRVKSIHVNSSQLKSTNRSELTQSSQFFSTHVTQLNSTELNPTQLNHLNSSDLISTEQKSTESNSTQLNSIISILLNLSQLNSTQRN